MAPKLIKMQIVAVSWERDISRCRKSVLNKDRNVGYFENSTLQLLEGNHGFCFKFYNYILSKVAVYKTMKTAKSC